jgi:protoporphyrinogen oxidase
VWSASDEELASVVVDAIGATGLPQVRLDGVHVRRLPHVYPVYERGFADALDGLERWAEDLPGITTFGRLGLFAHDNTHHALVMADAAASAIGDDGRWDAAQWAAARERFRQHVVED